MHSTRITAFLIGAWIAGCLALDFMTIQNFRLASNALANPAAQLSAMAQAAGVEQTREVIRHLVAEQARFYFAIWEFVQIPFLAAIAGVLYFATEKRALPPALVGFIILLVAFQAFAITPELSYRGRAVDFPPGSQNPGMQARAWALMQVFIAVEAAKLILGGLLAGYLFTYKARRRARGGSDSREHKPAAMTRSAGR